MHCMLDPTKNDENLPWSSMVPVFLCCGYEYFYIVKVGKHMSCHKWTLPGEDCFNYTVFLHP